MTEESKGAGSGEPAATTRTGPMAEMCERFMSRCACSPKEFSAAGCCSGEETVAPEEAAATGGKS